METTKTLPFMKNRGLLDELSTPPAQREGIIIEKGAVLNRDYLEDNEELLKKYIEFFTSYPDLFLDLIAPADSNFKLFFYQRILLRVIMRYKKIYITAPRAFSKSFISILALILQCIFMPGTKRFICAPGKGQSVKIAKEKIKEILTIYPFLRREIKGWQQKDIPGIYNADEVELNFTNGSILNVVGALNSTRGGRRHGGLIDEIRRNVLKIYSILDEILLFIRRNTNEMLYLFYRQSDHSRTLCRTNN